MAMNGRRITSLDPGATEAYAHLFQAFADPTRLAVVQHLATGEHRVRDLVEHMGFAQSTVSKHLAFLVECGIVRMRPEGRSTWYSLADTELLRTLISAAEQLLSATGNPATLCTHLHSVPGERVMQGADSGPVV